MEEGYWSYLFVHDFCRLRFRKIYDKMVDRGESFYKGVEIMGKSAKACVSLVPIFNHLNGEQMDEIMQVVRRATFEKGETVYHAGDASDTLFIVNRGQLKTYYLTEAGKEQVVRILNPGDFTGELAVFQASIQEAFAEALMETQICMIKQEDLQALLLKYPTIAVEILKELAGRLNQTEKQATSFANETVETRIALFLAESYDETSDGTVELPMSKRNVASYLGTTPETLSRRLKELEEAGIIEQEGQRKIKIIDIDALLLL